ncbi:hypothetical protein C8A03DRAFT_15201 [Achaetomium macrosporum]|uniref:Rho-GAP domain-containing protein n=1 Tax=Achaetomium macrosporum TaxID=79813 RepID=A0AAN7CBN6_9PEZI|nr:hypothetical protein C8A03DRAFT_15201 [Achaetomium macrosporum]
MSDMLEDGLREQLAAALLGWGGGDGGGMQRKSSESTDNDDCDRGTPKTERAFSVGHRQGYIRGLMEYADQDGDMTAVDYDIDADSTHDASDAFDAASEGGWRSQQQPRDTSTAERSTPAAEKALPPLPVDTPLASPGSPPLEMSCRISRFPFSHPCEVPELMPDQEDFPSVSDPVTPSVATDVFRPLTEVLSPPLELGPFPNPASQPDLYDRVPRMAIKSVVSDLSAPNVPESIPEEEDDDVNTDGVSMLTPTEVSFDTGDGECGSTRVDKNGSLVVEDSRPSQSVSSLGSGSMSSSEWRPSQASGPRKSVNLFSRRRNGGRGPLEEECLERRSLTPAQLNTPGPSHPGGLLRPGPASPTSPTSPAAPASRAETSMASRFFNHMPWMHDPRPGKAEAVFGVDLKESIRVAPMKIRISHKGRSTSYRTFPLSVHKCCEFIRRAGGTDGDIFAAPGNAYNVSQLKAIFSQPPTYGEQFQFQGSDYTVYDAARLILIFLEELPKPLIPPSVVKSWILLARQEGAIEPPCPRVETGLDFWTEALNRLPTANRNLTKHLLTLFAEVLLAATGTVTEADARQLASTVSRAMFHQDADAGPLDSKNRDLKKKPVRRNVQPTLALAFLIKKRAEYAIRLDEASKRDMTKRDSKLFLPSTREIMEWKEKGAAGA